MGKTVAVSGENVRLGGFDDLLQLVLDELDQRTVVDPMPGKLRRINVPRATCRKRPRGFMVLLDEITDGIFQDESEPDGLIVCSNYVQMESLGHFAVSSFATASGRRTVGESPR